MSEDLTNMDNNKKKELLQRIRVFPKTTSRNLLSGRKEGEERRFTSGQGTSLEFPSKPSASVDKTADWWWGSNSSADTILKRKGLSIVAADMVPCSTPPSGGAPLTSLSHNQSRPNCFLVILVICDLRFLTYDFYVGKR